MGQDLVPVALAAKQPGNSRLLQKSPSSFPWLPRQEPSRYRAEGWEMSGPRVLVPGRAGAAVRSHHGLEGILCHRLHGCGTAPGGAASPSSWYEATDPSTGSFPHAMALGWRCDGMWNPGPWLHPTGSMQLPWVHLSLGTGCVGRTEARALKQGRTRHSPTWADLPMGLIPILSRREGTVVGWRQSWQDRGGNYVLLGIKQATACHFS